MAAPAAAIIAITRPAQGRRIRLAGARFEFANGCHCCRALSAGRAHQSRPRQPGAVQLAGRLLYLAPTRCPIASETIISQVPSQCRSLLAALARLGNALDCSTTTCYRFPVLCRQQRRQATGSARRADWFQSDAADCILSFRLERRRPGERAGLDCALSVGPLASSGGAIRTSGVRVRARARNQVAAAAARSRRGRPRRANEPFSGAVQID